MNKTPTIRSLGWLIGLILLFSWHVQAKSNPPHQSVQFTKFFDASTPVNPPGPNTPISLTAIAGVPFKYQLPALLPYQSAIYTSPQLPGNGLDVSYETLPPSIVGTPDATGVMNLTINANLTVNGQPEAAWVAVTITVLSPTPISLTATAGVPFTYELPVLIPENNAGYTSPQLPANGLGLSYDTYPPSISGTPNATGVMNLTINASNISNGQAHRAWVPIRITVTAPTPISLTATAGVPFTYHIPVLLSPNNTFYTSPQLPANGLSTSYSTYPPSIVGTPLASGVMNLTINASNGKPESAWVPIILTVNPSPGSALTLLAPTYNCTTGAFHFNTSGGNGSPITYFAIGITGPTTNPDQFVDTEQRTASDAPPILLQATQNGTTVTYLWDIRAQCPVGPTPPSNALTLLPPTYNCTTGAFHFNTSGGNGSPITYFAIGITGPTTNPDQFVDTEQRTAADAQPLHLQATQSGVTVSYVWDIRAQCPVGPTPPSNALTLLAPTYNCTTGAFHFNTSGGDGSPITYFAIGITGPTTNPDQFVDTEQRTVNDVQPFLLQATQNGTTVTYLWNLKAACGRARLSAPESEHSLHVKLLGNPVVGDRVHIEVSGAEDQPLLVTLINQQGRPISEARIVKATTVERIELKLSRSAGVHLLQVSSLDQTKVVRVVKAD